MFKPYGIVPPIVLPLTSDEHIDEKALRRLIDFEIEGGVHGIFPLGTTGEFYGLTDDEVRLVFEICKDQVAGRVPLYAGTPHITTRGAVRLAQIAEDVGVDCLSILTPMFITPNQEELYQHYKTIAENTSLPILLYNNKPKTGVHITPATVSRLADIPNIIGVKDSTGDMTNTEEYLRLTKGKEFSVMMGRDTLICAALQYGAVGAIASCANVAPELFSSIYNDYMAGNVEKAMETQFKVAPLRIAFNLGTFPSVIKAALKLRGVDCGPCFAPCGPLSEDEMSKLKTIMHDLELI